MISLRQIAKVTAGQAAPKEFADEGYPFIRAGHLKGLLSNLSLNDIPKISEEVAQKKRLKKIPKGTIVFAKSGMSATKNRVYITEKDSYFVSHLAGILPSKEFSSSYLARFLYWYNPSKLILDSAYPSIRLEDIKNLKILLPPLDQQKKIAAILDAADTYRQKTKVLIVKHDELIKSLFLEMFGDPVRNSKGWELKSLSEFIKSLNTGVSVNSINKEYREGDFGILKTSCVYSGIFRPSEAKVIRVDEYERMRLSPKADSIIISRMNTTELVGKSAYIENDYNNLFLPDRLWQTEKAELSYNVRWLSHAVSFQSFRNEIGKISSGTSGSMKNISKKNYLKLPMIYPSKNLQNQFAERVQAIEAQKAQAQASLAQAEDLFNSLLQRAFKGELINL